MFCSTIIPTIGRPTLAHAVQSVLEQDFTENDFEVIVVNDSGKPLPEEAWQRSSRVRVIQTNRCERSVARNTGAAMANGDYIHFLDDDDVLLPGALSSFWGLACKDHDASWLYGSWRIVDNDGKFIDEFHPELTGNIFALLVAGEGLPLQASLLKAKSFFDVGGFDPRFSACEDRDLGRRLAMFYSINFTPDCVSQIRIGEVGSSTNWSLLSENDRLGREKAFNLPNAYARVQASAKTSYWRGRVSRAFFASMAWNLKHRQFLPAFSRLVAGFVTTSLYFLSLDYWKGLRNIR